MQSKQHRRIARIAMVESKQASKPLQWQNAVAVTTVAFVSAAAAERSSVSQAAVTAGVRVLIGESGGRQYCPIIV
jgi:hypothetical protein